MSRTVIGKASTASATWPESHCAHCVTCHREISPGGLMKVHFPESSGPGDESGPREYHHEHCGPPADNV